MEFNCKPSTSLSPKLPKKKKSKKKKIINIIHPVYQNEEFIKKFNCWKENGKSIKNYTPEKEDLKIVNTPFNCAFLPNFINDESLLEEVSSELQNLNLHHKNNDLYKFNCSEDFKGINKSSIQKLCSHFEGPIKDWVQNVTGIQLNDKVSISCSKYDYSDILLCHDDELEGRRIAFILYMVPSWKKKYGGSLDMFSVDHLNRPFRIAERFYPQFNSFAFFEVSPVSFHQVAEVLTEDESRWSINGWFHGEPLEYPPRPALASTIFVFPGHVQEGVVYAWLSPLYLAPATQTDIRKDFQEKSEIQLPDFLKKKKYDELCAALRGGELDWRWVGPPNKKHLEIVNRNCVPDVVREYLSLMQSEAVFLILSQLTGLELHHLAPQDDPSGGESDLSSEADSNSESGSVNDVEAESARDPVKDSPDTATSFSKGSGTTNSSCSNKSRKRKNKGANGKKGHKRRLEANSEQDTQKAVESAVGGLLDVGWECDVETEVLCAVAESRKRGAETKAEVSCEVRRWRWGAYSLMRDDDPASSCADFLLDATLFCNVTPRWDALCGGATVYAAKGDAQELLTVVPVPNSLALVYRDKETLKFTKHINVKSTSRPESAYHEICCEYREIV